MSNKEADEAKLQFEEFATNYDPRYSDKFNSFNVSINVWINFMVNFFTKISSTNQYRKFLFPFLPCHMSKAKLKEVLV